MHRKYPVNVPLIKIIMFLSKLIAVSRYRNCRSEQAPSQILKFSPFITGMSAASTVFFSRTTNLSVEVVPLTYILEVSGEGTGGNSVSYG